MSGEGATVPLSRLLYVSRSKLADDHDRPAQVRALAARAAERNERAQLTGSLLHVGDRFIQVLEGPPAAVEQTFERICCDFRHDSVKLIDLVPVKQRVFPEWRMALLSDEGETRVKLRGDLEEIRFMVGIDAREAVRQMRRLLDKAG